MQKNETKDFLSGAGFLAAFAAWTALLCTVDVQPLGVNGTLIGLAAMNVRFHRLTGVHMALYTVTDWLGLVPIAVCLLFAAIGLAQWVRRRSILRVDADILLLGGYYIVVMLAYVLFDAAAVNVRPVLIAGVPEPSYPSSSTLLTLSVMLSLIEQLSRRLPCAAARRILTAAAMAFSVWMVIARLLSGVHWLTDIVGGVLLSAGLFRLYRAAVTRLLKNNRS